ncbi:A-kinase anchor protein 12b isoform X1 [Mobula birostris]|uniref:A-kinase anchor protein 12b isoform X1 n=1 Tax=Mobula birostris TaxID=1983395 RepID=UPI003B27D3BE
MGVGASLQELAAPGQPDSRGEREERCPETSDHHSDEGADGKSVLKNDQISGIQGDVTDKKSEELNGIHEDIDAKQVGQGDPVLVSGGEETEEMQLNKEVPIENEHGEQKDIEKGDELLTEVGVPAEEVQATEVCFNVFKCMGLKFAMKNEKPVRAEPVQLLNASQEEGGEAERAVSEPRQEMEGSTEANSEAEGSSPEILTPEKAEECTDQEETKVMDTEVIPTAAEPAVSTSGSPVVERLLRRFFRQDYFSGLRMKQSSMKDKEAPQITDKEGREVTRREATERGPDAQPSTSQDAAKVSVAWSPEKNQGGEEDFEDLTAELASVRAASEAPAVGEIVASEVKENGATAEHSMAAGDLGIDQQIPSAGKPVGEAGVDSLAPEAPAEFQVEHKKAQKKSSVSTLDPISAEGELVSSQKSNHQDSPIKNLLTSCSIKKLTKEDKGEKGEASTGDLNDEAKLQSSTKWKGSPDSSKPDSPPVFLEKMDEGILAEVTESDLLPVEQEEANGDGDGERREAITAWASFKKLMTPKKHPKELLDNERGDQATDKAKSMTVSTENTASEKQEEPSSSGEESKLDQTTEDLKKKADTTAAWEALICVASSKKRVRKQSDSDRQKPNKEAQTSEANDQVQDHAEDREGSTSQGPDQEQKERSLSCAKSPVEGEATNGVISTWESFKRFMSPRRRSSSKLRECREESEPKPAATEAAKEESWAPLKKLIHGRKKMRPNTKLQQPQSKPAGKDAADTEFAGNQSEEEPETPSVVPISEYDDIDMMQMPVTTAEETPLGRDDAMVGRVLQEGQKEATKNVNLLDYPAMSSCQTQALPSSQVDIPKHKPDVSTGEGLSKEEPGTFTTGVAEPTQKAAEKILAITGPLAENNTLATPGEATVQEMHAELQEVAPKQEIPPTAIDQVLKQDAVQAGECQHLLPAEHQEVNESITAISVPAARKDEATIEQVDDTTSDVAQRVTVGKAEAPAVDSSENAQEIRVEKALAESMEVASLQENRVERSAETLVQVEKNVAGTECFEETEVSFLPVEVSQVETSEQNVEVTPAVSMIEVLPAEDTVEIIAEEMMETESHIEPTEITSTVEVTEAVCCEMTDVTPEGIKEALSGEEPIEISPSVRVTEAVCSDMTTELTAVEVAEAVLGEEPIETSQAVEVTQVMCRGMDEISPGGAITVMHDEESTEITLAGIREIITSVQPVEISPLPLTEIGPGKEPIDINPSMGVTEVVCSEETTKITPELVSKTSTSEEPIKITPVGVTEAVLGEVMTELDGVTEVLLDKEPIEILPVRITEALCSEEKTECSVAVVQEIAPAAIEQDLKPDAAQTGECQPLLPVECQVIDDNMTATTISKDGALSVEEGKSGNKEVVREQMLAASQSEDDAETVADKEQSLKDAEEQGKGEPQTITPAPDKAGAEQIIECRKTEIIPAPAAKKDEAAIGQVGDTTSDVAQQVTVGKAEAPAVDNSENAQGIRVEKVLAESMEVASLQENRVERSAGTPVQVEKNVAGTECFEETGVSFLPVEVSQVETSEQYVEVTPAVSMIEVLSAEETVEIIAEEMMETESHIEPTKITSEMGATEVVYGEMTGITPEGIKEAPLCEEPIKISPAVGVTEAVCSDVTTELTAAEVAEAVLGEEPIEISQAVEVTEVMCRGINEIRPDGAITVMHDEESTEITLAGIREIITGVQPVEISPLPLTETDPGKEPIDINPSMRVTEVVYSEETTEITPELVSKTSTSEEPIKITPVGVTEAVLGEVMTELDGVTEVLLDKEPIEILPVRITEALCSEEKTECSVAVVQEIAPAAIEQDLKPDAAQTGECQPLLPVECQVIDDNVTATTISKDGALSIEEGKTGNKEVVREQMLAVSQSEDDAETVADKEQSLKGAEERGKGEPQTITPAPDKAGAEQIIECRKTEIIPAPAAKKDEAAIGQVGDTTSDVAQQVTVGKAEAPAVDNSENAQEIRVEKALAESMEVASLQENRVERSAETPVQVEKNVAETECFEETGVSFLPVGVSQVETSEQNVEVTPAMSMIEVLPAEETVEIIAEEMMETESHIEPTKITSEMGATEVVYGEMTGITSEGIKEAPLCEEPIKISPAVGVTEAVCSDVTTELTATEVAEAVLGKEPIEISQVVEVTKVMCRGINEITPEGATAVVCDEETAEITSVGVRKIIPGEQPVGTSLYLTKIVPVENTINITPMIGKTETGDTWEEPTEITPELVSETLSSEEPIKITPTVGVMEAVCGEEFTELAPLEKTMVKTSKEQNEVVAMGVIEGGGEEAAASLEVGVEESKYEHKEGEIPQQEENERCKDAVQKVMGSEVGKQFSTAAIVQQDMGTENLDNGIGDMVHDEPVETPEQQRTQKAVIDSLSSATQILQSITTEGGSKETDETATIKGEVKSKTVSDELKGTVLVQPAASVTVPRDDRETSPREHPEKSVMEAAETQAGEVLAAKQVETEGACVTSELPSAASEGESLSVEQAMSIESAEEVECKLASKEKDKPVLDEPMKKITLVQGDQLTATNQDDQSVPNSKLCQHVEGAAEPQGDVELNSPSAAPLVEEQTLTMSAPQSLVGLSETKHEDTKTCTTLESASEVKLCSAFVNECQARQNETVPPVEDLSVVRSSKSCEEAILVTASSVEEAVSAEIETTVAAEVPEHSAVDQVLPPCEDVKQVSIVETANEVGTGHMSRTADNSGTGLITNVQKAESCRRVQLEGQPAECKVKETITQKKKCLEAQLEIEVSQTQLFEQQSTQAAQGLIQDTLALNQLQGQDSMKEEDNLFRLQKDMAVDQELETLLSQDIERKGKVLMQSAEMVLTTIVSSGQESTETETLASTHSESSDSASGKFSLSSEATKAECRQSLDQNETAHPSMELTEQTQLVTIQTLVRGGLVNESVE